MLVLIIFSLIIQINADQSKSCYACASSDLRNSWYLTGLPSVGDNYFTVDCTSVRGNAVETCSGPCLTLAFDDPNSLINQGNLLIVRGCHQTLTQVASNRFTNNNDPSYSNFNQTDFCELDNTYKMTNNKGASVSVRMMSRLCNTDRCNHDELNSNTFPPNTCSNQTNDNLLNGNPLGCYECKPGVGKNCLDSKCTKKYCLKQEIKLDSGYQIVKTCSNINILGIDNYCQTFDIFTNPAGISIKNQYTQCYCKDKQFCNSEWKPTVILSILSVLTFKIFI